MITTGTLLVIFLLAYGKLKTNDYLFYLLKVLIIFSVYINIGYFLKVGSFELAYSEILTFIFMIFGFTLINRVKIDIPSILIVTIFLVTIISGYWLLLNDSSPPMGLPVGGSWDNVFFGFEHMSELSFNGTHTKRFIRIVLFIAVCFIIDKYIIQDNERTVAVKKFIVKMAVYAAWFGIVEQISRIFFSSDIVTKAVGFVFGIGTSQLTHMVERGGFPALQGFMLEPGHYAQSFLPAILILLRDPVFTEAQRFRRFLLFAYVLFFSGSFAGFAILLMMSALYVCSYRQKVWMKLSIGISLASLSVVVMKWIYSPLLDYYLLRINGLLQNKSMAGGSEGVRMLSIRSALNLFYDHPLFGIGFGSMDVHGVVPSMLANFGMLGTSLWLIIMLRGFTKTKIVDCRWLVMLIPVLFFIGDTGTIYSIGMILIFYLVFRKRIEMAEKHTLKVGVLNKRKNATDEPIPST